MLYVVHGKLGMLRALEEKISGWVDEIRTLLDACRQLVQYYGSEEAGKLFQQGAEAPLCFLEALKLVASGSESVDTTSGPSFSKFICDEELAVMLTPLLRIVVEWEPDFVVDVRQTLDEEKQRRFLVPYGQFLGTVGTYLCNPMWTTYPHLAPEGWLA